MDLSQTVDALLELRIEGRTIEALPDAVSPPDLPAAYRAQARLVDALCERWGGQRAGYKIAVSNPAAQRMLGVPHPVFGTLIDTRIHDDGATLAADDYVVRLIECEIAFRIAADVPPADVPYTRTSIEPYVGALHPAIEIVEHHFADISRVTAVSLAADNAIHGAWVRGAPVEHWREVDLAAQPTRLLVDGEERLTGSGGRVLGHPLESLAWLANELPRHGLALGAGDYVTTGVTTDEIHPARAGERLCAELPGLGAVSLAFV